MIQNGIKGLVLDASVATRVGTRPAASARVTILEYFPGANWADIEAEDPSNLIGAIVKADAVRQIPELVINELFAWADEKGFRYRAAVSPTARQESTRLVEVLRDIVRGFVPELPALALRRARVTAQAADGRVSVQQVDRAGDVADFGRNEGAVRFYAGLPGASADLDTSSAPETILAFCRADWSDPIAFLAPPKGQPGHAPTTVRLEATTAVRLVGNSDGVVYAGATTAPVALAPDLVNYLTKLELYLAAIDGVLTGLVGPSLTPLITARSDAADFSSIPATKLEAE